MPYIFIDESGQFSKRNNEKYFVVGSFTVGDQRRTDKRFRSWQTSRFPRKMRNQPEIKFADVSITDEFRIKTLKFIADLDVRIHYSYLLKQSIPYDYWKKNKLQSGLLYTNVIGETLDLYLPTNEPEFRVFCDERHLKGMKRSEFKAALKARLLPQLPANALIQIEMMNSTANANIQIADWISGAIASYLEEKRSGDAYFRVLKNNLLREEGKELFKNW